MYGLKNASTEIAVSGLHHRTELSTTAAYKMGVGLASNCFAK